MDTRFQCLPLFVLHPGSFFPPSVPFNVLFRFCFRFDYSLISSVVSFPFHFLFVSLPENQAIEDVEKRCRRLVELNVQESCINLFANPIVQKKQATCAMPKIHGWAYDVENGLLRELKIDFKVRCRWLSLPRRLPPL